jgi:uncharacterized protein
MEITPLIPGDRQVIQGYGRDRFRISGEEHAGPLLVFPDRVVAWTATRIEELSVESFEDVLRAEPKVEILILGCGERTTFPPPALRRELRRRGIAIEAMGTAAACRTYNVLLSEERRVAAALIPLG